MRWLIVAAYTKDDGGERAADLLRSNGFGVTLVGVLPEDAPIPKLVGPVGVDLENPEPAIGPAERRLMKLRRRHH
jgi:hypothetical protein